MSLYPPDYTEPFLRFDAHHRHQIAIVSKRPMETRTSRTVYWLKTARLKLPSRAGSQSHCMHCPFKSLKVPRLGMQTGPIASLEYHSEYLAGCHAILKIPRALRQDSRYPCLLPVLSIDTRESHLYDPYHPKDDQRGRRRMGGPRNVRCTPARASCLFCHATRVEPP
jgi:hypothetical protein